MTTRRRWVVSVSIVTAVAVGAGGVVVAGSDRVAAADAPAGSVTVSGRGIAVGSPDVLKVQFGISARGDDVTTAIERSNAGVRQVRAALRKQDLADKDIQTQGIDVGDTYSKRNPGYRATQTLAVTLRDLGSAGRAIADAAAVGGNSTRIYEVSYDIEDREKLLGQAREAAFANAKAKAARYAELAGRPLGAVKSVDENVREDYQVYEEGLSAAAPAAKSAKADRGSAIPFAAGSQQVSVVSKVVWGLG